MPKIRRFSESLPMRLLRAREATMSRFRPVLHAHGLTEQQWRVLRALDDLGELTAAGLAQECSILAPSMTRILKRLAADELIGTRRSQADQRELLVNMTPKGRRIVAHVGPKVEQVYAEIREQLGPENLANLYEDLERVISLPDSGKGAASSVPRATARRRIG